MAASGCWPTPAAAFGADGHRVVGLIAEARLCAPARAWLAPLLDGGDLASAGVWPDAVRDDPAWAHSAPWHYVNVGDDEPLADAMRRQGGNVLSALERFEGELADARRTREERATALRFFVHFVADVHQPLHVGRPEDRGGNDLTVRWGEERLSLHKFWDAHALLAAEALPLRELAIAVAALAEGQEAAWLAGGPVAWAEESRGYRRLVYDLPWRRGVARLPARYLATARNVVSLRLAQAGVRVADRLNRLGCPPGAANAPPSR